MGAMNDLSPFEISRLSYGRSPYPPILLLEELYRLWARIVRGIRDMWTSKIRGDGDIELNWDLSLDVSLYVKLMKL